MIFLPESFLAYNSGVSAVFWRGRRNSSHNRRAFFLRISGKKKTSCLLCLLGYYNENFLFDESTDSRQPADFSPGCAGRSLAAERRSLVGHWCQQISSQQTFIQQTSSSFNSDLTNTKFSWKKYFSAGLKVIKFNFVWKLANNYMFPIYSNIKQPLVPISTYPSIQRS